MAHIKEVAEKAGVSISTVSRAISGKVLVDPETKKRVFQAVQELNYQPNALAKGLKEGSSKTIGLVIPNIRNLIFPAAIKGITDVAKANGYTVVLCNTDDDPETEKFYTENLRQRLVDGLIFSTATRESAPYIMNLKQTGYPVVLFLRGLPEAIDAVVVDNLKGGYDATRFLIQRGYRKIALINGTLSLELYRKRYSGYRAALAIAGIPFDPELVIHETTGWEDGYRAFKEIRQRGCNPDAIFATSDPKALGVIKALKEMNLRVPQDVAVMGYDNLELSELMDPPLTTMAQPFYEAGVKAAQRLVKLIHNKQGLQPELKLLEAELLVRQSVGFGNAFPKGN